MFKLKILNKKKIKEIEAIMEKQWDVSSANSLISLEKEYAFAMNNEGKIYLINKRIAEVDLSKLRINSVGLYIAQLTGAELRLSIEGSQLFGKSATKNILELNRGMVDLWMKGHAIPCSQEGRTMFIMKYNDDFLGCGKLVDNMLINYVPKERRVKSEDVPE